MEARDTQANPGILARPEILAYFSRDWPDRVAVTPMIDPDLQIGSNSIDLRLGCEFIVRRHGRVPFLDFAQEERAFEAVLRQSHDRFRVGLGELVTLHDRQFMLASTLEYIRLPSTLAGLVIGRSSWERLGIKIPTTRISPGFRGCLTIQLINNGETPIGLRPGARLFQLILIPVSSPVEDKSRYELAVRPGLSEIHKDPEIRALTQGKFPLIIGVVGTLVSGKTEVAQYLVQERGFLHLSLSTLVRDETRTRGLETTVANLQDVGNSMRRTHGAAALVHLLRPRMETLPGGSQLVIEGIKNMAEVEELRKWPNFVLVATDAPQQLRFDRGVQRGRPGTPSELSEFKKVDERDRGIGEPHWGQGVDACIAAASFTIPTDSTVDALYKELEAILSTLDYGGAPLRP